MKDVNETLNQIEHLLCEAEDALANDNGRRWPPPPAPPKNRRDRATDNSDAGDPHDYESCKAYVFANLPIRPQIQPGTFPELGAHDMAQGLQGCRNQWVEIASSISPTCWNADLEWVQADVNECRTVYGMIIDIKTDVLSIQVRWSGDDSPRPDTRDITHAQRVAEQRLLSCRKPLLAVIDEAQRRAGSVWDLHNRIKGHESKHELERFFADNVVQWLPRITACTKQFNRLSSDLYKARWHLLLVPGRRMGFRPSDKLAYPWWPRSRYLRWQTVIDLVVAGFPDDWRLPKSWNFPRSRLLAEVKRWARFRTAKRCQ